MIGALGLDQDLVRFHPDDSSGSFVHKWIKDPETWCSAKQDGRARRHEESKFDAAPKQSTNKKDYEVLLGVLVLF